jgi:tetratricopeptide (TPR) repeat protein
MIKQLKFIQIIVMLFITKELVYNLGKYNEVIECYDQAIKIDPNYTLAINNKNNLLKKISNNKK